METSKGERLTPRENGQSYPYDAIVVLPYDMSFNSGTIRRSPQGNRTIHKMSHFTSRAILAGLELFQEGKAPLFILPGEQKDPSTSDLERDYLVRMGVDTDRIFTAENLNGTQQQLDSIADLQKNGNLGKVLVVAFEFHKRRAGDLIGQWGINADIAEVEEMHVRFLKEQSYGRSKVDRSILINLPQLEKVKKAEHGIARRLANMDRSFGRRAPFARTAKFIMGPTITDIDRRTTKIGLVRIERIKRALKLSGMINGK